MFDRILDQVASIRDEYLKLQGNALDQMELYAAQGHAKETSAFSSEAERHGAAILACKRILAILEAQPAPPQGEARQQAPVVKPLEWEERSGSYYADTAFGEVCIESDDNGIIWSITRGRVKIEHESVEEAKRDIQSSHDDAVSDWLVASPPAQAVPEGWKLVPRNPTEIMMNAGLYQASHDAAWADVYSSWVDMYDAAPDAPTGTASPAGEDER